MFLSTKLLFFKKCVWIFLKCLKISAPLSKVSLMYLRLSLTLSISITDSAYSLSLSHKDAGKATRCVGPLTLQERAPKC